MNRTALQEACDARVFVCVCLPEGLPDSVEAIFILDCDDNAANLRYGAADGYGTAGSCREAHDIGRAKHRSFIETYGLDAHQFPLLMLRPSNWAEPFITVT